jgi:NADPH:quinone reductase-like Zn-dependent oxidoreductase
MSVEAARSFWVVAPGRGEIRAEAMRAPRGEEVLVRTLFSGISRGTEALVFQGRVPPSEFLRMRAPFQDGDFPGPVKYGYACVGIVEDGRSDLRGQRVFVLHPHQSHFIVPMGAIHVVPDAVPSERAVLAANLETAINGLWDGRPHIGDRVAVVGGGTVGCLVAWLASRVVGCQVELVDVNPNRARIARALGVDFAEPGQAQPEADVVLHASATAAGLDTALRLAGFEATIVELSWYGVDVVPAPLGRAFHAKRLTLKSSQVGHVPDSQRGRWSTKRRMALALRLLADPTLDVLITGESGFDSLPETMEAVATSPGDTLCHRIRYV